MRSKRRNFFLIKITIHTFSWAKHALEKGSCSSTPIQFDFFSLYKNHGGARGVHRRGIAQQFYKVPFARLGMENMEISWCSASRPTHANYTSSISVREVFRRRIWWCRQRSRLEAQHAPKSGRSLARTKVVAPTDGAGRGARNWARAGCTGAQRGAVVL